MQSSLAGVILAQFISRRIGKWFSLLIFVVVLGASMFIAAPAFAKNSCDDLSDNSEWTTGMESIIVDINRGNLDTALQTANHLSSDICDSSPVLLYTMGKIYEAKNDVAQAKMQFQKATDLTFKYAVEPNMAQKMWNARYEIEHPDRTEKSVSKLNEEIKQLKIENEKLQNLQAKHSKLNEATEQLNGENEKLLQTIQTEHLELQNANSELRSIHEAWMWTGTGAGIVGICLLSAGATLVVLNNEKPIEEVEPKGKSLSEFGYKIRNEYRAGWALVGTGIALVVAGAVLAGYFGYQYTHSQIIDDMSLTVAPMGASFSMKF